jgi:hypothetical protein
MPERTESPEAHWLAEYNFWHKIITEEVERLRFNDGFEPLSVDLYPIETKTGPAFIGKTQIGHARFRAAANWSFDSNGKKILRLHILKAP